jgi:hypothetical protein
MGGSGEEAMARRRFSTPLLTVRHLSLTQMIFVDSVHISAFSFSALILMLYDGFFRGLLALSVTAVQETRGMSYVRVLYILS